MKKQRKVEHVRWFESLNEGQNSNKFIVVFDDGMVYVFFREQHDQQKTSNISKTFRIPTAKNSTPETYLTINRKDFVPGPGQPEFKEYSKE